METEEKKDNDLLFMILAALLGIGILAYLYYSSTKTTTSTSSTTTSNPSKTTTSTTTSTSNPASSSGSGTSTTINPGGAIKSVPPVPTAAPFLSYPQKINDFSYTFTLTNGAIGITVTEDFPQTMPNWTVYASINPQFEPYVQLGNIPVNTIYWNGYGQPGGQADNLSCFVPVYPIKQYLTTPYGYTLYFVVVDTNNKVRSAVGNISIEESWI